MTWVAVLLLFAAVGQSAPQAAPTYSSGQSGEFIAPTRPGTSDRDYNAAGYLKDGNILYPTRLGTSDRDYSAPGLIIENGKMYPTMPGTGERDYRDVKPSNPAKGKK